MTTLREEFEALMPEPVANASKGPVAFFVKWTDTGSPLRGSIPLCTADQVREAMKAVAERCAVQEREKTAELLAALKDLSKMYTHAWDLVDGGLTMMGESVPLFEKRHKAASKAIERFDAAAIRAQAGGDHE